MRPKWPKLASLARKYARSSYSSSVHSLLPTDNLLKNIFSFIYIIDNCLADTYLKFFQNPSYSVGILIMQVVVTFI